MTTAEMIQIPILGLKYNGEPFQFLPLKREADTLVIGVFNWFVSRTFQNVGDYVDLLFSNRIIANIPYEHQLGRVEEVIPSLSKGNVEYKIKLGFQPPSLQNNWVVDFFSQEHNLNENDSPKILINLIKDTYYLKSGIRIYFKHLKAYFSRISPYNPKEYSEINKYLFLDIENHIIRNEKGIQQLYENWAVNLSSHEDIALNVNLEQLRETIESEISLDLLSHIFMGGVGTNGMPIQVQIQGANPCVAYLAAIKNLERRLYINYNTIVLLYSLSLAK